jgi:c-di-GMP-binding flagellar brake protein YcgR
MNRMPATLAEIDIGTTLPKDLAVAHDIRQAGEAAGRESLSALNEQAVAAAQSAEDAAFTFESMKMKVGDRLQVQLPARFTADRIIVRLIGYINNLSLLVTPPREANGLRMQLEENDELVVRVFTSQNAFGFSATVAKVIKLPFEYLHLSFPSEVRGMVIRKAPRVKTRIICSVVAEQSTGESATGILTNLSANGALLTASRALAGKSGMIKLAFRVMLHGTEAFLNISAIVRAQFVDDTPANPNPASHGLEFVDLQPKDYLVLQSMIYQQMIEQPQTVM